MPNKEESSRHRMVVEEIEISSNPKKTEESVVEEPAKPQILDEAVKVSSEELIANDNVQLTEDKPVEHVHQHDISPKVEKQKSPVFWILIPGIFLLGAILGGVIFYQKGVSTNSTDSTPAPVTSVEPTVAPTSSPSATVDVSKVDVAVFNGSGIAGEAGKVKTILEDAGFTVTSTANAATYDYTKTIIKAKDTVDPSVITKLTSTLSESYEVGDNQTLSSTSTTDIQIVVGSSKAE
jgi:hypothetical protein